MRFTDSRRPQQQYRLGIGNEASSRNLADLLLVDRGLGGKVETVEVAHERETRQPDAHLDAALVLAGDLPLAEQRERLTNGQLAPRRLVDQAVELIADRCQLEPVQHRDQMIVLHHQRPPTSPSYSSSGRSSSGAAMVSETAAISTGALGLEPTTPSKCTGSITRSNRPIRRW